MVPSRKVTIAGVLSGLLLLVPACSAEPSQSNTSAVSSKSLACIDGNLKVGVAKALSGGASFFDTAGLNGFQIAVDQINESGGIKGCKIQLEIRDTKSDPGLGAQVAQSLISDGAQILVVADDFDNGVGAAKVGQNAGVLTLSMAASSTVFAKAVGDLFFNGGVSTTELGRAQAKFVMDKQWMTTFQVIDPSLAYFTEQQARYQEKYTAAGGSVVGSQQVDSNQSDFSAIVSAVKSSKPAVVQLLAVYPQVGTLIKQLRSAGVDTPVIGPLTLQNSQLIDLVGSANSQNIYYAQQAYYEAAGVDLETDPEIVEFVQRYQQKFGHAPEQPNAIGAYQMFTAVSDALKVGSVVDGKSAAAEIRKQTDIQVPGGILNHWQDGYAVWSPSITGVNNGTWKLAATYSESDLGA